MVSYQNLDQGDLSGLQEAEQEWRALKNACKGLGDQYEKQVMKRLKAHWEGPAAQQAASTMAKNKQEMDEAAKEAARISKLFGDIHHDLGEHQNKLRKWQQEAQELHFKVGPDGSITDDHPRFKDKEAQKAPDFEEWRQRRNQSLNATATNLKNILKAATETDGAASAALQADFNGEEDRGFNTSGHKTVEEAAEAQKDAKRAADLMKKDRPTPTEIAELNKLLGKHSSDPVFAESFAKSQPPRDMLDKYMGMMNPIPEPSAQQKKNLLELQKNLGSTLGTASNVDSVAMDKFEKDLLAANEEAFTRPTPDGGSNFKYGYQVTASLMHSGNWDDETLKTSGSDVIKHEQAINQFWGTGRESSWPGPDGLIETDPMVGLSDGLGHNPDAATEFFNSSTDTEDGRTNNLDYMMKEREWHGGGEDKAHLGNALVAGSTGHPYDEKPPNPPIPHTAEQANIFKEVVNHTSKDLSDDGEFAKDGMGKSLGRMAAEYMPELNRSLAKGNDEISNDLLIGNGGASPNIDQSDATRFLYQTSRDPEGYGAVVAGQQRYAADVMEYHFKNPDAYSGGIEQSVGLVALMDGQVEGIAASARADSVIDGQVEKDAEFNQGLKFGGDVAKGIISVGGAVGTGGAGTAAAGAAGSWAVDQLVDSLKQDNAGEAGYKAGADYAKHQEATQSNLEDLVKKLDREHPGAFGENSPSGTVFENVKNGYSAGHVSGDEMADNEPPKAG